VQFYFAQAQKKYASPYIFEAFSRVGKVPFPAAIYLDLGFESLSHFSHSFKKKFGRAPSEWL